MDLCGKGDNIDILRDFSEACRKDLWKQDFNLGMAGRTFTIIDLGATGLDFDQPHPAADPRGNLRVKSERRYATPSPSGALPAITSG